jgi:polyphosphate:AMP phosphotransferase
VFEAAEVGRELSKQDHAAAVPALRTGLLEAQRALRQAGVPVIVVVSGADGAGKGETVNRLVEWLDPRGVETNVFGPLSDEERDRPAFWRFWRTLPAAGRIGIFFGSWYTDPIVRRAHRQLRPAEFDALLERIGFFEQMLVADGALIVKFWLHLGKKAQRRRLEALESDRRTRWRVSRTDWKNFELYDRFKRICERALRRTDSAGAPWTVVEAADDRYREVTVASALLAAMRGRLVPQAPPGKARAAAAVVKAAPAPASKAERVGVLDRVDLVRRVSDREYDSRLPKLQGRLSRLARQAQERGLSTVALFEGWDAAGKGGAIRRITEAVDARLYRVVPIAAPTDEERAHHYLWRFWRHIPRAGFLTIFDRSWYGRVLVERVEGFAREEQWRRAYLEINDFEEQLTSQGALLLKFWLHVSPQEQLRRFKDRQRTAYKQHKITAEDWRNRKQWPAYAAAVNEMVVRTSTPDAPWTLVGGDDKHAARLTILETLVERLERAL